MMDGQEAEVVAAAQGRLVTKSDGQFDRQIQFQRRLGEITSSSSRMTALPITST